MKLYYSPGSCGLASQIALREAGQAFDLIAVDFKTRTTVEGDYLKVSPKGFIPTLKLDDGDLITEGVVILQWIADHNPEAGLLPAFGGRERYAALEWLNFIATDIHKSFAILFSPLVDGVSKTNLAEKSLALRFDHVERRLSEADYLLGERFSVADAYLYNVLSWSPRVNVDLSKYRAINRFMTRIEARPSVRAALAAEGLSPSY